MFGNVIKTGIVSMLLIIPAYGANKSEKFIRDKSIQLWSLTGACSGVQITTGIGKKARQYVLSAAHCAEPNETHMLATLESGQPFVLNILAKNTETDLLLLEGIPGLKGIHLGKKKAALSEHIRTFTHGGVWNTYKTEGEIVGYYERLSVTSAWVVMGSSGGMVVNDAGKLVGIMSAKDINGPFSYMINLSDIKAFTAGY